MLAHKVWRNDTSGLVLAIGGILLAVIVLDLDALAHIARASFLIVHLGVHVAPWRLIDETKGNRLTVAVGSLTMAEVLANFPWATAIAKPRPVALIVVFVASSWAIGVFLVKKIRFQPGQGPGAEDRACAEEVQTSPPINRSWYKVRSLDHREAF